MSVRKRTWVTKGEAREAWVVDYTDAAGKRRLKTFQRKKDADNFAATTRVEIGKGTHVADRATVTVAEAAALWMQSGKDAGLERSTLQQARSHVDLHIVPLIGATKLNKLTVPSTRALAQQLRDNGRSPALVKKVLTSLSGIVADAMERGLAAHNPVRESRAHRGKRHNKATRERRRLLEVGVDIPAPAEIRAILGAATGFRRAFFMVAAMAGLRASELRGLRWQDVDLSKGVIIVRVRADRWNVMGNPKSAAGNRTIPVPPSVVLALKEWRLQCPLHDTGRKDEGGNAVKELWLVFPNSAGNHYSLGNIVMRHYWPLQVAAGVSVPAMADDGKPLMDKERKPVMRAKYLGMHALRHFFASWCAARPQDGGLGLPLKTVQYRMGHAKISLTADRYSHLFPSQDDSEVLSAGERALLGA